MDFIYADFKSAIKEQLKTIELENLLREFAEQEGIKKAPIHKDEPEKIYSRLQERIEEYYQYAETISNIEDIAYASLYSAICPPIFKKGSDKKGQTIWYGNYLLRLQQEYLEMIEFCFDEDYYPEALANRLPSERFYISCSVSSAIASRTSSTSKRSLLIINEYSSLVSTFRILESQRNPLRNNLRIIVLVLL